MVSSAVPPFSIVTVTLNDKAGLSATAASVLSQSCLDYEWLIIDGKSTDGTLDLLAELSSERCRFISEKDKGIYDAMNKGVALSRGTYLIFLNAGDIFADETVLEKIEQSLTTRGTDPDFLFGDAYEITATGERLLKKARSAQTISYGMFTHHQAMLYRRAFAGDAPFDTSYRIAGDYDFTARFLKRGASTLQLPFAVCSFERGGLSMTNPARGREEALLVQKRVLHLSLGRRLLNKTALVSSALLRRYGRRFYDRLRFAKG